MQHHLRFLLLAILLTFSSGCIFFSSGTSRFGAFGNPSRLFPWNAPRFYVPAEKPAVEQWAPQIEPSAVESIEGPAILPQGMRMVTGLSVTVEAPRQEQIGSPAKFELTLQNNDREPLRDVVVEVEFDAELLFPGSAEKKVRRTLGTIPAGETKKISLLLTGTEAGRLCSRFTVFSQGREKIWKSVCVEFVP